MLRPDGVPVGEFGDKFRKEREKKGISLDDVSNVTKIGSRMLQAIEEERFDRLPGGVFNKGFIRAYAKHLGLNDEEAVTEYLACLRQAQIDAQASWQPPAREAAPPKRAPAETGARQSSAKESKSVPPPAPVQPSNQTHELPELHLPRAEHVHSQRRAYLEHGESGIPWRIVAVAAVIIVLATVLWQRHSRSTPQPATNAASANPSSTASAPAASASNTAPGTKPAQSADARPSTQNPDASPSARPAATPAVEAPGENVTDGTADAPAPANSRSATTAPAPLKLVIRASENSWVSVSADGQAASQETLIAPAHTSVRARQEVVVRVGNAAGVSFLFNGKEIPPQGSESEVKTLVFDSSGLKSALPGPTPATVN